MIFFFGFGFFYMTFRVIGIMKCIEIVNIGGGSGEGSINVVDIEFV